MKKFLGSIVTLSLVFNSIQAMAVTVEKINIADMREATQRADKTALENKITLSNQTSELNQKLEISNQQLKSILKESKNRGLNLDQTPIDPELVSKFSLAATFGGALGMIIMMVRSSVVKTGKVGLVIAIISTLTSIIGVIGFGISGIFLGTYEHQLQKMSDEQLKYELNNVQKNISTYVGDLNDLNQKLSRIN